MEWGHSGTQRSAAHLQQTWEVQVCKGRLPSPLGPSFRLPLFWMMGFSHQNLPGDPI